MANGLDQHTQAIVDEFLELAKIPRKSGHEEAVSKYLYEWALKNGFKATRDEVNNVSIEKPGDKGLENKPLTILQGHMDMVCVGEEGYDYDPLTSPIKVINNDNKTLTAYRTSLGADDGIGVAIAQYILKTGKEMGPLRVIFTVNEEELMLGAEKIDAKYLDADYLINLDSEEDSILTDSSAGGMCVNLGKTPQKVKPELDCPLQLTIGGLLGGHSGVEINTGRLNAVRAMGYLLLGLSQNGVALELGGLKGGTADNAIPSFCSADIVIASKEMERFKQVFEQISKLLHETYDYVEKNMKLTYEPIQKPSAVIGKQDQEAFLLYVTQIINGVHTMSPVVPGLVQSSSNLGVVNADTDHIHLSVYWRSSDELYIEQMNAQNRALADVCGFDYVLKSRAPGWPVNPYSRLVPLMTDVYKEQSLSDMEVKAIHAGLECSWFYTKNPKLDVVSVGPNLTGVHSPDETLEIASISKTWKLVEETLKKIAE